MALLLLFSLVCGLLAWRLWFAAPHSRRRRQTSANKNTSKSLRTLVVIGSGGHTAEMLRLLATLPGQRYTPRHYLISKTDTHSEGKVLEFEQSLFDSPENALDRSSRYSITFIPRSREVGQSWISTMFTTAYSLLFCIASVFSTNPDLLLVNGPGTCVPVGWSVVLMNMLYLWRRSKCKIIYVESICRVRSLSLSAKLLYPFVDRLFVQWPSLARGRAEFRGRLI